MCDAGHEFTCKSALCVPLSWQCDGDNDCIDGSDEENCDARTNVHNHVCRNEFMCNTSHECIHPAWVCDGEQDCRDASDEDPTRCMHFITIPMSLTVASV